MIYQTLNPIIEKLLSLEIEEQKQLAASQKRDIFNPENSKLPDPEIISLIDSLSNEFVMGNTPEVYNFIGKIESNNNPKAKSGISKASGIYQFTPNEVKTTKNRAKRTVGYNKEYVDKIPNDPTEWNKEQANVMLTSYLFPKEIKGSPGLVDELLKRSFTQKNDIDAWKELYKLHHTNLDKTRYLGRINKNIDRILSEYIE